MVSALASCARGPLKFKLFLAISYKQAQKIALDLENRGIVLSV